MVAGKFDPVHDGHLLHIWKASQLGGYLYIITHTDEAITQVKGYCSTPLWARKIILEGILSVLKIKGEVITAEPLDLDGTIANTIRKLKPNILAKGGDRTPSNMPQNELDACKEVGCQIVYGVGDLLNSSSKIMRRENENRRD